MSRQMIVVDMPEKQLVGALERQADALAHEVERVLQASEHERDGGSVGDARRFGDGFRRW